VSCDREPELVRAVGLASLFALALNGMIGAGVFVLPAAVARILGPAGPAAYLVAGAVAGLMVLCFAEAGSRCDATGGPYVYAREAFGGFVGFQAGWMFLVSRLTAVAAIANGFCSYLGYFWAPLGGGAGRALAMTAALGALALINVLGVRRGALAVNIFTIGKLVPLLLFATAGLLHASADSVTFIPSAFGPLKQASLVLVFAFGGFESASVPSEEMVNARRNLPIALVTAVAATAVLYVAIQIAAQSALPDLARSPTPLASAARVFLGPAGATILTLGAVLSTIGAASANILAAPRMIYALARARLLPAPLARVHPRHRSPHLAILTFAAVSWALAVSGSFAQLAALSAVSRLFFNITTCLAVPVLRRRPAPPGAFRLPGGPLIPALAVACALWLLTGSSRRELVGGLLAFFAGTILYVLSRRARVVDPAAGRVF
jgi:APA family basic amino acid/polyamine antiporter